MNTPSHHEDFTAPQYNPLLRVVYVAAPPSNSKKRYINFVTGVSVRSLHLTDFLEPDIEAALDETVRVIQGHKDLLGDIAPLYVSLHPPVSLSALVHAPAVPLWAHICFTVLIMFILK